MRFMLGTHMESWLWEDDPRFDGVTLFVSRNRLARRISPFPAARRDWALDSGGFTELSQHGQWRISAEQYAEEVRRYRDQLGRLLWAAPQDWMCEPWIISKTSLTVEEHLRRTVENLLTLRRIAPDLKIIPSLQGWLLEHYQLCERMYEDAGVDLSAEPVVALGSVCRRQATSEIGEIVQHFHSKGLRLHGFGVKTEGLADYGDQLVSADSLAWSYGARRDPKLPGCTHRAKNCANCPTYALRWHQRIVTAPRQLTFALEAAA